jgi:hypothetical protein
MPQLRNARHEKYAQEYARSGNATKAAIHAGYATQNATRLKRNEIVAKRITELTNKIIEKTEKNTIADATERREFLTSVMRGEVLSHGVVGGEAAMVPPTSRERVMATELLAKLEGEFLQTTVTNVFNTLVIERDAEELSMARSALFSPGDARVIDARVVSEPNIVTLETERNLEE